MPYRLGKNSLFCADGVNGDFLLLTDLSPLRAKKRRFLVGIKKLLFFSSLTTPAPASQARRSKGALLNRLLLCWAVGAGGKAHAKGRKGRNDARAGMM